MENWIIWTAGQILAVGVLLAAWEVAAIAAFGAGRHRLALTLVVSSIFAGWFFVALTRALGAPYPGITFNLLLGGTIIAASLALFLIPGWRKTIAAIPLHWLIGMQALRVIGGVFLIGLANEALPRNFAIPAAYGDVATGVLAIPAAWAVARRVAGWKWIAWAIGVFGLADLIVAVGIGTGILAPLAAQIFGTSSVNANTNLSGFPLSLIPTFLVPQAVILHIYAFWRLSRKHDVV